MAEQFYPLSAQLIISSLERIEGKVDRGVADVADLKARMEVVAKVTADHVASDVDAHKEFRAGIARADDTRKTLRRYAAIAAVVLTSALEVAKSLFIHFVLGRTQA